MCMCVCVDGYVNDKVSYICLHIWFGWEVLAQSWKKFKTSFRSVWVTKLQIIEKSLKVFLTFLVQDKLDSDYDSEIGKTE